MGRPNRHPCEHRGCQGHAGHVEKFTTGTGTRGGRSYEAMCSCGWRGPTRNRNERDAAIADLEAHIAEVST